jgi:uncharacterized protein involved in exopolysaccharide biosynthesis
MPARTESDRLYDDLYPLIASAPAEPATGGGLRRIESLGLIWRARAIVLRALFAGMAAGLALAFLLPPSYTSVATLMPPDQEFGSGEAMMTALASKASSSVSGLGADLLGLKTSGDLLVGMLKSRAVAEAIVYKFQLQRVYGLSREEDILKKLAARTSVSQDRKSGIITVEVSDRSRQRAREMAGEYITQLDQVVIQLNTSSAGRERIFLEGRLSAVKGELDAAQRAFAEFLSRNQALELREQGHALIEVGAKLSAQLGSAQAELEALRQSFADGNVRVRAARARVQELNRQLANLSGQATNSPRDGGATPALSPSIRELPALGGTYYELMGRVKIEESVFQILTKKYELAKVEEAKQTPSVKILDPPALPERPSFPPRGGIVFFAALLSGLGAAAAVLWKSYWRTLPAEDPRKLLAREIGSDFFALAPAGLKSSLWFKKPLSRPPQ